MNGNFCIDVHVEAFLGGEFDAHAVAGDFPCFTIFQVVHNV
jgi:hypothetical protein